MHPPTDYQRIEQAIHYLRHNAPRQPSLAEIAAHLGLSESHFQRLFTRWAGISPKRFLQFLTKENAKAALQTSSVLESTYQSGLSSPGRLHDLLIHTEAVTPGQYKQRGAGLAIHYGLHPTPFGECLLGLTDLGICFLGFMEKGAGRPEAVLRAEWPQATLIADSARTAPHVEPLFHLAAAPAPLALHLVGTNFQLKVWEALLRIPPAGLTTYAGLACAIGQPRAARAVGSALAHNPIAILVPCHRVIRGLGEFGQYRYGTERKMALLAWEQAAFTNP